METIRRRVENNKAMVNPTSGSNSDIDSINIDKKSFKNEEGYRNELFVAVLIPFVILLIFGGRYSLLTTCFGGLMCYIFDLLGSVEVFYL